MLRGGDDNKICGPLLRTMFLKPDASVMLLYIPMLPFLLFRRVSGRLGPRSVFLVWTAALKKILTLDVLS